MVISDANLCLCLFTFSLWVFLHVHTNCLCLLIYALRSCILIVLFLDVGEFGVVLDLFTRLDIAIDVSHALTYLHVYAGWCLIA